MERGHHKSETDHQRLLRISVDCRNGEAARAEMALYAWLRDESCPATARVMLAAMWARRGKLEDAKEILQGVYEQEIETWRPSEVQLLISVLIACDLVDAAKRLGKALYKGYGQYEEIGKWLRTMSVPGSVELPYVSEKLVVRLAEQLAENLDVLGSLVYAQKHEPRAKSVLMLRHAMMRVVKGEMCETDELLCVVGLAELAMLAGDHRDVKRWAKRGLKIDPYHARLALLLSEIEQTYAENVARKHLAAVARKHPHYPDVRSALIRQKFADGKTESAKRKLDNWLKYDPASMLAQQLRMKFSSHYEPELEDVREEEVAA
ncbi:hypothetical protein JD969_04255 [Planctomycetota bacterium]|nr:hypothetical protein JD969_04255 [Planctomycetota bacterium]